MLTTDNLYVKKLNRQEFKDLLNTKHEYDTEEFWQNDSDTIFYMDGNLDTVLSAISEEGFDYQDFSFYLVNDDQYFAMC